MVKPVEVANERIGDGTQLQEAIPLGIVAGQPGSFQAEDQADLAQGDLLGHLRKAVAGHDPRTGMSQVFVDHLDLLLGPAQLSRALRQLVLALGRLAVDEHLRGRGLADVNVSPTAPMRVLDFEIIAHGF
jgi:hypothetical protein